MANSSKDAGPVTKELLAAWYGKLAPGYIRRLGLSAWAIHVVFDDLDDDNAAECYALPEYRRATLSFDASKIVDREDFEANLRHELMHVVHSATEDFFRLAYQFAPPNSVVGRMVREAARQCAERLQVSLEDMYQGLTRAD